MNITKFEFTDSEHVRHTLLFETVDVVGNRLPWKLNQHGLTAVALLNKRLIAMSGTKSTFRFEGTALSFTIKQAFLSGGFVLDHKGTIVPGQNVTLGEQLSSEEIESITDGEHNQLVDQNTSQEALGEARRFLKAVLARTPTQVTADRWRNLAILAALAIGFALALVLFRESKKIHFLWLVLLGNLVFWPVIWGLYTLWLKPPTSVRRCADPAVPSHLGTTACSDGKQDDAKPAAPL